MKVRRFLHPDVVCIEAWQSLREAAKVMHSRGFSCLPVTSGGELVGIITERDIVEAMADSNEPQEATVFDFMTETPKTVGPEDDAAVAVTQMLAAGCRHLPVVEDSRLVGILSARDLLLFATAGVVEG